MSSLSRSELSIKRKGCMRNVTVPAFEISTEEIDNVEISSEQEQNIKHDSNHESDSERNLLQPPDRNTKLIKGSWQNNRSCSTPPVNLIEDDLSKNLPKINQSMNKLQRAKHMWTPYDERDHGKTLLLDKKGCSFDATMADNLFGRNDSQGSGLILHKFRNRRESFLYRSDSETEYSPYVSRNPSFSSNVDIKNSDEPIVTPFAQILASLRKVRTNFISITNTSSTRDVRSGQRYSIQRDENVPNIVSNIVATQPETSSAPSSLANETLHELEWCLERLENIQTHRSVSDMASSKFKKLLNKELSQFASDGSKSGTQISEYICSTFLDPANEPDVLSPQKDQMINHDSLMPLMMKKKIKDKTRFVTDGSNFTRLDILARNCDLHVGVKAEHVAKVQGIGIAGEIVPHYGVKHSEELDEFLKKNPLNRWGLDVFELAKITEYPLTCITFTILKDRGTLEKFKIPHWNAIRYFMLAENHYNSKAPYHNRIHAADVVQSTNVLLDAPALQSGSLLNLFGDLEVFAVIFACAIHDVDHPGVTNQYLINTNDSLAVLYNDSSVLENHHLAVAFTLLNQNGCDLTVNLSKMQRSSFRRMVIDMVLATDMSKHMSLLADLKTMVETKKVSGISVLNLEKYTNRIQILQNMVHCADLSNPAKPLELYKQWNSRIMEEFFFQGDLERAADLDISPMCDRKTASLEKSQVSFIDFIVHPLWETWSELVHPDGQEILELLQSNREWYFSSITNETQKAEEIFHSEKLQSTKEEEVEHDPKPSQI